MESQAVKWIVTNENKICKHTQVCIDIQEEREFRGGEFINGEGIIDIYLFIHLLLTCFVPSCVIRFCWSLCLT